MSEPESPIDKEPQILDEGRRALESEYAAWFEVFIRDDEIADLKAKAGIAPAAITGNNGSAVIVDAGATAVKETIEMKRHQKGSKWTEDEWKELLDAEKKGHTPDVLASFHDVARQVINIQLKSAREHFRTGKVADLSMVAQVVRFGGGK
jgi:hypothetical protein